MCWARSSVALSTHRSRHATYTCTCIVTIHVYMYCKHIAVSGTACMVQGLQAGYNPRDTHKLHTLRFGNQNNTATLPGRHVWAASCGSCVTATHNKSLSGRTDHNLTTTVITSRSNTSITGHLVVTCPLCQLGRCMLGEVVTNESTWCGNSSFSRQISNSFILKTLVHGEYIMIPDV
jgi:hypothetical protein